MAKTTKMPKKKYLDLYAKVIIIRKLEEKIDELFRAGVIYGPVHTSVGQEASAVGVAEALNDDDFVLAQNYPNPFSDITYIDYQIPQNAYVQLTIYNLMGQPVSTLVSEHQTAGLYQVEWNGSDQGSGYVPNGIYFYRLAIQSSGKNLVLTNKLILMQ